MQCSAQAIRTRRRAAQCSVAYAGAAIISVSHAAPHDRRRCSMRPRRSDLRRVCNAEASVQEITLSIYRPPQDTFPGELLNPVCTCENLFCDDCSRSHEDFKPKRMCCRFGEIACVCFTRERERERERCAGLRFGSKLDPLSVPLRILSYCSDYLMRCLQRVPGRRSCTNCTACRSPCRP